MTGEGRDGGRAVHRPERVDYGIVQQFENKILRGRLQRVGIGFRLIWFDGEEELGRVEDLQSILNRYGRQGWEAVSTVAVVNEVQLTLKRPGEPSEAVPAPAPEGRGDEPAPAED